MPNIDFPTSPSVNQTYTFNGKTWIWTGTAWISTASTNPLAASAGGTGQSSYTAGDVLYASGTAALSKLSAGTNSYILRTNGSGSAPSWETQGIFSAGRLTLESGVPVSTTDQTSKTTIYYTPYNGDKISLYDGTSWATYLFTERSLALGTLTSGLNYDVFLYNNSGTLTLELTAWSTDTTRVTSLVMTNGVYLKSGALTRRYLGTIRTTSTTTTEDSNSKRFLWNYNNRVNRMLLKQYVASSWTYATANTYRYLGNNSANSVAFVNGVQEDNIFIVASVGSAGSGIQRQLAIGFDAEWSTSLAGNSTSQYEATAVQAEASNESYQSFANRIAGLGYHVAYALELQNSATTVTYFGGIEAGISGNWRC